MTRAIERIARGLLRVAENRVVKFFGIDPGTPDRFLAGHGGQVHGGKVAQFAAIAAHGRARAVNDCNVCSLCHMRNLLYEESDRAGQTLKFTILSVGVPSPDQSGSVLI